MIKKDQSFHKPIFLAMTLLFALWLVASRTALASSSAVFINEIHYDNLGTDAGEAIEIAGPADTDLSGWSLILYNGSTGAVYDTTALSGTIPALGSGYGVVVVNYPSNGLQNGSPDGIALVDSSNNVVQFLSYEGSFTAIGGPADGVTSVDIGVAESSDTADGNSLQLKGTGLTYADFSWSPADSNTFGAFNTSQIFSTPLPEACGNSYTPIYTIQGSGLTSPHDGEFLSTEGVVVGDFQDGKGGFFIQDANGDGDPSTSDGIFVFSTSSDVNVGDLVRVRGTVDEFFGLTEITSVSQILLCSTGNSVAPTELSLPVSSLDDFEAYEGMLVTLPQSLYISEFFNFDRFGEIVLTTERQFQPTAIFEPGSPEAAQLALDNSLSRITLDDGRGSSNPDPAIHPNGSIFNLDNLFRGGDTIQNVTGVLDYNFGLYKIQPTQGADYTSANPRTENPDDVGGNLKVASFNVLNYFTTIDDSGPICGPLQNQGCRGADTPEEFTRQRDKIIAALAAIDADVVGLIEIENHPGDVPTADLVSGLNDAVGTGTYEYIATGAIGSDAIRQALIYKPEMVSPVGDYAILDSSVDSRFNDDKNRPVLAQTFQDNLTGGIFTVVVNHLKSKGSDCNDVGDPDTGNGSGNCNLTRKAAAEALVYWLASDPTSSGDSDFLIIGDLNSYDKEDPIDVLVAGGYTDLLFNYGGEFTYTYVFDGQLGYLDHALANADLMDQVTGVTAWHINADEPDIIDYDMTFKEDAQDALYEPNAYRSSDHDPVIVGLNVCGEVAPELEVSVTPDTLWPPNHEYVTVEATVVATDNFDLNPTVTLVSVTSNEPDNGEDDGNTIDDIVIVDGFKFKLRAERSGVGSGRTYTIRYRAEDDCGNAIDGSATVFVPINQMM